MSTTTTTPPYDIERYFPVAEVAPFIEGYWCAQWDARGNEPLFFENLPHPKVFAIFGHRASSVHGVVTGRFSRCLRGRGRMLGMTFRAGAFFPFVKAPVAGIRNKSVPFHIAFGESARGLTETLAGEFDTRRAISHLERFIRDRLPERDANADLAAAIVAEIARDRCARRVEDVAKRFGLRTRTLERLFYRYVGATAKWAIKHYRLRDAATRIATAPSHEWSRLAVELGYFDQSHFINDFRTILGRTPAEFARNAAR